MKWTTDTSVTISITCSQNIMFSTAWGWMTLYIHVFNSTSQTLNGIYFDIAKLKGKQTNKRKWDLSRRLTFWSNAGILFFLQNTLLRSRHPELTSTIKKSTCVLAVVLFVALNIGPFRWEFHVKNILFGLTCLYWFIYKAYMHCTLLSFFIWGHFFKRTGLKVDQKKKRKFLSA